MQLELITLTGPKYQAEAYEVILPTVDGMIAVLPKHMPLVTLLVPGPIGIRHNKSDQNIDYYATNGGIAEIGDNKVRLLVDEADHSSEIALEEAREALRQAEITKQQAKDKVSLDEAQALIDRYAVRIHVAELDRMRGRRVKMPPTSP